MLSKPNPSSTTLYAASEELESHAVRFIMAHKLIEREVIELKFDEMPEEVLELNPCETRSEGCWYELVEKILHGAKKESDAARKTLHGNLIELLPLFSHKPYFKSETMTLVDVCIAPILWRLDVLGISLDGKKAKPILDYANRLFEKEGFQESLTFAEKDFN